MEIKEYVAKRKEELKSFFAGKKDVPFLTIVSVGDDPASAAYVKGKTKDLAEVGFGYELLRLPATASEEEVLSILKIKDEDPAVSGILVQLPLPKQIRESAINKTIVPEKDVDGFTPLSPYDSCTPKGIVMYLTAFLSGARMPSSSEEARSSGSRWRSFFLPRTAMSPSSTPGQADRIWNSI